MARRKDPYKLTIKRKRFCEEYICDLNASQAAIRAGYSGKTSRQIGNSLLTNLDVQEYIRKLNADRSERTQITADAVLGELAKLGFADIRKIFSNKSGALLSPVDMGDDIAAAVQSVEVITKSCINEDGERGVEHVHKIRLADKRGSLELLGKHLELFTDKVRVEIGDLEKMTDKELDTELRNLVED